MTIAEIPTDIATTLLTQVGKIGLYFQAIGIIIIIWLIFQILNIKINYKTKKKIENIEKELKELKILIKKSKK